MTTIEKSFLDGEISANQSGKVHKTGVLRIYYFAGIFYILPFISLLLFIVDQLTFRKTQMLFWVIFLVSLGPCGLIGIILCTLGLIKSFKRKSGSNKIIGFAGLLLGMGGIIAGILGFLLIYLVVQ